MFILAHGEVPASVTDDEKYPQFINVQVQLFQDNAALFGVDGFDNPFHHVQRDINDSMGNRPADGFWKIVDPIQYPVNGVRPLNIYGLIIPHGLS